MAKTKRFGLWTTFGVIAVILVILISSIVGSYNNLVALSGEVEQKQSAISTQLQRRNDLIPNLVSTVKGYAKHEEDVFISVTEARSKVIEADTVEEQAAASAALSSELDALLNFTYENYPQLQANQNFIALQSQLEGTENRINIARNDYNTAAKELNVRVRKFPTNIIAGIFGFDAVEYFQAEDGAEKVPEVNFE